MKNRFQSLNYYSIPTTILFVLRKRIDAILSFFFLLLVLFWTVL